MTRTEFPKSKANLLLAAFTFKASAVAAVTMEAFKLAFGAPYPWWVCSIIFPSGLLLYSIALGVVYLWLGAAGETASSAEKETNEKADRSEPAQET